MAVDNPHHVWTEQRVTLLERRTPPRPNGRLDARPREARGKVPRPQLPKYSKRKLCPVKVAPVRLSHRKERLVTVPPAAAVSSQPLPSPSPVSRKDCHPGSAGEAPPGYPGRRSRAPPGRVLATGEGSNLKDGQPHPCGPLKPARLVSRGQPEGSAALPGFHGCHHPEGVA